MKSDRRVTLNRCNPQGPNFKYKKWKLDVATGALVNKFHNTPLLINQAAEQEVMIYLDYAN